MAEPIDLTAERNRRTGPDAEHVRKDDFGRPMYHFALSYDMADGQWCAGIWAYSMEDAQARVDAMRASLRLDGQVMKIV